MRDLLPTHFDIVEVSQLLLVAVVVISLVFSGPLVSGISLTSSESKSLGDGNATVSSVALDTDAIRISPGRFGTDTWYLRVPAARAQVDSIDGQPRLVYQLSVPALGIEIVEPELLSGTGRVTVRTRDRAISSERPSNESYDGRVTLRVQSFTTDRVLVNQSITVEVRR